MLASAPKVYCRINEELWRRGEDQILPEATTKMTERLARIEKSFRDGINSATVKIRQNANHARQTNGHSGTE